MKFDFSKLKTALFHNILLVLFGTKPFYYHVFVCLIFFCHVYVIQFFFKRVTFESVVADVGKRLPPVELTFITRLLWRKYKTYLHSRLEIILLSGLIPKTRKIRPQQYNVSTFNTKHSSGEVVAKQRRLLPNYVMF